MTQTRFDDYEAPDSTVRFNNKLRGIIKQGVYTGYHVCVASSGNGVPSAGLELALRHATDPDVDPVDLGVIGATILDGGGDPRQFRSIGQNFLTTVTEGDILKINDTVDILDNGEYIITSVIDNENLLVERDWVSGGGAIINLTYTIHHACGYLRTPDGVIVSEDICYDPDLFPPPPPVWPLTLAVGGAQDRIDRVIARYVYNAGLPNNLCTYLVVPGVPAAVPVPPTVTDNDIVLADVYVAAGVGGVSENEIYNAEKMDLYATANSYKIDDKNGWVRPGVYTGFDLYTAGGSPVTDISLRAGSLITPQYYKLREDVNLADAVSVAFAAAGNYRFDWIICLHRWTAMDPVDNPYYMVVTGTPVVLASEATFPSDANILTATALVGAKYDSMDYVTKIGYVKVTQTTVTHYNMEHIAIADQIRVSDGIPAEANRPEYYSGPYGLSKAIDDFMDIYDGLLYDISTGWTDAKGTPATILLDGRFTMPRTLQIPSCLKLKGEGAPARIEFQDATTEYINLGGRLTAYNGAANIFGAAAAVVIAGTPAGYGGFTLTLAAAYQVGDNYQQQRIMAGDMVEIYSPTTVQPLKFATGWVHSVTAAWGLTIILDTTGPLPAGAGSSADCSMVIRKRRNGIANLSCPMILAQFSNETFVQDIVSNYFWVDCAYKLAIKNLDIVDMGIFGTAAFTTVGAGAIVGGASEHFYNYHVTDSSKFGGTHNVYENVKVSSTGPAVGGIIQYLGCYETNSSYDNFRAHYPNDDCSIDFYGSDNRFERIYCGSVIDHSHMHTRGTVRCYFEHIVAEGTVHDIHVDATSSYNVFGNVQCDMTLEVGASNNTIFYCSHAHVYTDSSGVTTNVNYYIDITTWNNDYLNKSFNDWILPPYLNTGLVSNILTNPRGLYFGNATGIAGKERVLFSGISPVYDDKAMSQAPATTINTDKTFQLSSKDPRVRFYGDWIYVSESCAAAVIDGYSASIEITAVMTGILLHSIVSSAITMDVYVDGVGPLGVQTFLGRQNATIGTSTVSIIPETVIGVATGLSQNIHTVRFVTKNTGVALAAISGIDILNQNPTFDITELSGLITSDKQVKLLAHATNVPFASAGAYGGRAVRYIRDSDQSREWSINNYEHANNPATTVAGVVAGFIIPVASSANFSVGDIIRANDTDLYTINSILLNNITVDIAPPAYALGVTITRYCQTYNSGFGGTLDLDHRYSVIYYKRNFRDYSDDFRLLGNVNASSYGNISNNCEALVAVDCDATPVGGGSAFTDVLRMKTNVAEVIVTFVGTGLSVVVGSPLQFDPHNVSIDGADPTGGGALPQLFGAAISPMYVDICSHLPYGTHTVSLMKTAAAANVTELTEFVVWCPGELDNTLNKIYEYFALPTTPTIITYAAGAAPYLITVGAIRHFVHREWRFNNAAWARANNASDIGGSRITSGGAGHTAIFWYYGTQCVVWGTLGALATFTIDGAGAYLFNVLQGPVNVGWHYITITSSANPTLIMCADVVTPCHNFVNEQRCVGEYFVSDGNLKDVRSIAPNKPLIYPNTAITTYKSPKVGSVVNGNYGECDVGSEAHAFASWAAMLGVCHINSNGKPVLISVSASIVGVHAALVHVDYSIIVDGAYSPITIRAYLNHDEHDMFGQTIVKDLEPGHHTIILAGADSGGTGCLLENVSMIARECS